jgi:hypothetical protein
MSDYIQHLHHDILATARQFGMDDAVARDFAHAMVTRIQANHAGPAYIPQDKTQRNERIRRLFNGVNHDVVCAEFGISKSTLYRVIGR